MTSAAWESGPHGRHRLGLDSKGRKHLSESGRVPIAVIDELVGE